MNNNLNIIILAAGKGTRMKSSKPKVLHKIANHEMLLHVINLCSKIKPKNMFVVLGKDSDSIKTILPKNVKIIIQKEQLGTANALLSGREIIHKIKGKLLVLYGDVPLLEKRTLEKLITKSKNNISILGFESNNPKGYGRIKEKKNNVLEIIEDKNLKEKDKSIKLCYSGIFCGPTKVVYNLLSKVKKNKSHNEYLLTDIFKIANDENISIPIIYANEKEVMGVNNMYQLALAEDCFQDKLRKKFMIKGVNIQNPQSVFFSFDTKIEPDVSIGPNNIFGKNVVIKRNVFIHGNNNIEETIINSSSKIGPFCRLRGGNKIGKGVKIGNFVEIKNSYIGDKAKINHLAYIGDASVGKNSNIGAGTITCNYDGKIKHKTVIGNYVFIGSNCALVAPIKIKDNAFVAAGSTISKNVGIDDFSIARAQQKIVKKGRKKFLK